MHHNIITLESALNRRYYSTIGNIGRPLHILPLTDPLLNLVLKFSNDQIMTAETTLIHIYANNASFFRRIKNYIRRIFRAQTAKS